MTTRDNDAALYRDPGYPPGTRMRDIDGLHSASLQTKPKTSMRMADCADESLESDRKSPIAPPTPTPF